MRGNMASDVNGGTVLLVVAMEGKVGKVNGEGSPKLMGLSYDCTEEESPEKAGF